jgi:arsenate reductase
MTQRKVLFLCTHNSCRSQMAEALVNTEFSGTWVAYSAGSKPTKEVHPLALQVLAELGISHQGRPKSINELRSQAFDLIVTVCEDNSQDCPVWLGKGKQVHMAFPDPALATGSEEERLVVFRKVCNDLSTGIFPIIETFNSKEKH